MTKRRITRRQAWRIDKIQQERRQRAEKKEQQLGNLLEHDQLGPEQEGLLIAHYGTMTDVEDQQGHVTRCHLRQHLGVLVPGDRLVWRAVDKDSGVVTACHPRQSVLGRPDARGNVKPIASNIDQLFITVAPAPQISRLLIDSYLVAAETLAITPVIVLNKIDIVEQADEAQLNVYHQLGYRVLYASVYEKHGLDQLAAQLANKTSVFVGQSGVGKSSLINHFIPHRELRVGELSLSSGHGRHTTSTARLYHLPQGGSVIDSPGIREFGLWHMTADKITQGFVECRPFLNRCKFRNCQHQHEPGCALLQAVADGDIDADRLMNLLKIIQSG